MVHSRPDFLSLTKVLVLSKGGSIGTWSGTIQRLNEDCQMLRPTGTPQLKNDFLISSHGCNPCIMEFLFKRIFE